MGKIIKLILGLVLVYVVLMGGSGLAIKGMLSGSAGEEIRSRAQALLPVEVSIEGGEFDIAQWFLFRPAISFDNLRVANPEGFSAEPLFEASQVSARADLTALFDDAIAIQRIAVVEPNLLVEENGAGKTNIEALLEALQSGQSEPAQEPSGDGEGKAVSIDSFSIEEGSIRYALAGVDTPLVVKNVNVVIEDIDPTSPFDVNVALDIFEEEAVHVSFVGQTGPFRPASSPANGKLAVEAFPGRLRPEVRESYLGNMIADPGGDSRLAIDTDLTGDLMKELSGTGRLTVESVQLGKPDEPQLPLNGDAQVQLTLRNVLANPSYSIVLPDAQLTLGAGRWNGMVELRRDGSLLQGRSRGAVDGVDVNELLTAFTDSNNVLFGLLELKQYEVQFAGADSEQIMSSMQGGGRMDLSDGKLAMFDAVATIEKHINKVLGGDQADSGITTFVRFGTDFAIKDERVTTPNLLLENEGARIGGSGSFGFDQTLDYNLSTLISGALADRLGGTKNAEGVAQLAAPMRVSGTMSSPRVTPDVKSIAKQAAISQAAGALDRLLNKPTGEEAAGDAAAAGEQKPAIDLGGLLNEALGGKKKE